MALDPIHAFYCRKDFLDLALECKIKSGGVCAKCGEIFEIDELRAHHIIELTLDNIDDVNITLNPDNIEVLCHNCHNIPHRRFGAKVGPKHVYLVYGAPFAGKVDYVNSVATRNDLVVNLDNIHKSICVCGMYDKPDSTKQISFMIRDLLLNEIRTATTRRKWQDAYIIGTYPDRYDREMIEQEYCAELIHIATPKEDCIRNICATVKQFSIREAAIGWVEGYFQRFRA